MIQQAGETNMRYAFSKIRETLHKACKQMACKADRRDLCSVSYGYSGTIPERVSARWDIGQYRTRRGCYSSEWCRRDNCSCLCGFAFCLQGCFRQGNSCFRLTCTFLLTAKGNGTFKNQVQWNFWKNLRHFLFYKRKKSAFFLLFSEKSKKTYWQRRRNGL